jgi:hypothetical protein
MVMAQRNRGSQAMRENSQHSSPTRRPGLLLTIVISIFTAGIALPFLLWARGPKTKRKLLEASVVGIAIIALIAMTNAIEPSTIDPRTTLAEQQESSLSSKVTNNAIPSSSATDAADSAIPPLDPEPSNNIGSLDDVVVTTTKYLYSDCNVVDWCFQPRGTYRNTSSSRVISYLEVVYVINAGSATVRFVDRMLVELKPGRSVPIMSGENNYSFRLSFYDSDAAAIGSLLGSTYINWWAEVRYILYQGGLSVGKRVS